MTTRRRLMLAGLALPIASACRAQPTVEDDLETLVKKSGAPALAGAVFDKNGLVHIEAAGVRRNGEADKVTVDDRWHLGSNTKAMTAALYGRLVEAGRATWDAPLSTLLPDVPMDPAWKATTIDQLLAHRAGLKDDIMLDVAWLQVARDDTRPLDVQRRALAAKALAKPPTGKPGAFEYANGNYVLAGAAIERITGRTWEAAMREQVFGPLGMASAGFGAPQGANAWGHVSPPIIGSIMAPTAMNAASPMADNPLALGPAGTVHATLQDYGKFLRIFLTEGGGFLKPETIARLGRPVGEGDRTPYALGWSVSSATPWTKGPALLHEGSNTMWHALAVVAPARGVAIVGAANAGPHGTRMAVPLLVRRLQQAHAA